MFDLVSPEATLYASAADFLEAIRSNCERFDPSAVRYYKWLQGMKAEEEIWVLELARNSLYSQGSAIDTSCPKRPQCPEASATSSETKRSNSLRRSRNATRSPV
jgi:hypothetical protein